MTLTEGDLEEAPAKGASVALSRPLDLRAFDWQQVVGVTLHLDLPYEDVGQEAHEPFFFNLSIISLFDLVPVALIKPIANESQKNQHNDEVDSKDQCLRVIKTLRDVWNCNNLLRLVLLETLVLY